jgi:N-acetylneuraminate synthase
MLIEMAAEAGANAAKFQNFRAETIVSKVGFDQLGTKLSHQAKWDEDVFSVYKKAEVPVEWTDSLIASCQRNGIDYFTSPYDLGYIDFFAAKGVPFFKIGSGDINWKESIEKMCHHRIPIILATGASTLGEVKEAVSLIESLDVPYVLMQCNTNYTGEEKNINFLNIRVLNEFRELFPKAILGLSDHSDSFVPVIGAVALGARAIEKHFTDDRSRKGPDHAFSLDSKMWAEMVSRTRELEKSLGNGHKKIEKNEEESRIVQRRALRFSKDLKQGHVLQRDDLIALRPAPQNSFSPFVAESLVGLKLSRTVTSDTLVTEDALET